MSDLSRQDKKEIILGLIYRSLDVEYTDRTDEEMAERILKIAELPEEDSGDE